LISDAMSAMTLALDLWEDVFLFAKNFWTASLHYLNLRNLTINSLNNLKWLKFH